jgi:hypothetical protein
MKAVRRLAICLLALAVSGFAVEPARFADAVLVGVAPAAMGQGASCYDLEVRLADVVYIGRHCPQLPWHEYSRQEFVEGGRVPARVEGRKLLLLRPNGKELKAQITRRVDWALFEKEQEQAARFNSMLFR